MGYRFKGFFAPGDSRVLDAALQRWPYCAGRRIFTPFRGIGVRCPDPDDGSTSDEEFEELLERAAAVEEELPRFSILFPDTPFVFVSVDCFGGTCAYEGFVVRNGKLERELSMTYSRERLSQLLEPLGVRSRSGYFAPFVRGYWETP